MKDPYVKELNDTKLWERFLDMAFNADSYMAGILYWYRSVGVKLQLNRKFGFVMVPIISDGESWGWRDNEEWQKEKQWLVPYADLVGKLLYELRLEVNNKCL